MNPVIIPTHNCYELTVSCIDSVLSQDIPVQVLVLDNGSTDERLINYLSKMNAVENIECLFFGYNAGVSKAWNIGLASVFNSGLAEHALVLNNDLEIPPQYYRLLLETGDHFVSGTNIGTPNGGRYWHTGIVPKPERKYRIPHPDFSAFLIRKLCWDKVGSFDEDMVFYAQDCDYHVRMNREGIWAGSINLEYYHYASGTLKQATDEEKQQIAAQADCDRDQFTKKYGCRIGTAEYDKLFG
jgi:GT2 family glycosyltransferase